ncbi:hypothetical protein [Salmonella phage SE4]|uniref:holin n=1 Tax=Salmonella phage SE4 TaxID=2575328 RepID=UPI0011D2E381|nr:holin [Salmonella phage SE4]QEG07760.1 hypothetical protein [Salmonella phage SE4]
MLDYNDKSSLIGQFVAWVTAVISTLSLSDWGTLIGIISSLAMLVVVTYNQTRRTKIMSDYYKRKKPIEDEFASEEEVLRESKINSD